MKRFLAFALIACADWAASPAAAQDGWGWSVIIPSVTGTDQLGLHLRDQLSRRQGADATPPANPARLRYTPSRERRAANLRTFLERSRRVDPAGTQQLQALFASGDIIDRIDATMRPHGFRADDLGDVYALWWITAWQATRGTNEDKSPQTNAAVRLQAQRALGETAALAGAADAVKQELAESLMLQSLLIDAAVEQARSSADRMRAVGQAAAQGARGLGLDLSTMTLTENGFVPG